VSRTIKTFHGAVVVSDNNIAEAITSRRLQNLDEADWPEKSLSTQIEQVIDHEQQARERASEQTILR